MRHAAECIHHTLKKLDLYMGYKHPLQGVVAQGVEARNHDWLDQLKTDKIHK